MHYSKTTGGFYNHAFHGDGIPHDAVEITPEHYAALFKGQSEGRQIVAGENGYPILQDPPPAPPYVPQQVTRRQGRLALLQHGLLDDVEDAIAAIPDPLDRRAAQIEYEADTWERSNAFVQTMWAQLGGTPDTLDDLFRMAVTL